MDVNIKILRPGFFAAGVIFGILGLFIFFSGVSGIGCYDYGCLFGMVFGFLLLAAGAIGIFNAFKRNIEDIDVNDIEANQKTELSVLLQKRYIRKKIVTFSCLTLWTAFIMYLSPYPNLSQFLKQNVLFIIVVLTLGLILFYTPRSKVLFYFKFLLSLFLLISLIWILFAMDAVIFALIWVILLLIFMDFLNSEGKIIMRINL